MGSMSVIANCTNYCNLFCDHCYCEAGPDKTATISLEQFELALNDLRSMGINSPPVFDLTGGEFVYIPHASQISEMAHQAFPESIFILETNGHALLDNYDLFDSLNFDRLHISVDSFHENIGTSGESDVLKCAFEYQAIHGFKLVINHVPHPADSSLPRCIQDAMDRGIQVNIFKYNTLAQLGRGKKLGRILPGKTIVDDDDFFKCELGEALFLDPESGWHICHYPGPAGHLGPIGSPDVRNRFRRIIESRDYQLLTSGGLVECFLSKANMLPENKRKNLMGQQFFNRCEPCILLQQEGLLDFANEKNR